METILNAPIPAPSPAKAHEGEERLLGEDAGDDIWLKSGRFGPYVQRGEPTPENKKPPRASLPRGWSKDDMDLDKALTLLSLPRQIGEHPEGGMISSNFGRFGPYLMHQLADEAKPVYANLKDPNDVFEIGMNRAVEMLAEKRANPGSGPSRSGKSVEGIGRASRWRRDAGAGWALWAIREMGKGQRDHSPKTSSPRM